MEQKIKKILNEKLFTILVIITMVSLPLGQILGNFLGKKITPFYQYFFQEEILSFCGILLFFSLILYFGILFKNKKQHKLFIVLSDIFIILSIIFSIISIIFSKDIYTSLHGEYTYSETPLQVLAYFCLFFSCTLIINKKNRQLILNTFIILAISESLIAFLQVFEKWPSTSFLDNYTHTTNHLAFGLTSHCNYFATISILFTAIFSAIFLYQSYLKKDLCINYLCTIFCCFASYFTYTRLSWLGSIAIIIIFIFIEISYFIKYKNKKIFKKNILKILFLLFGFSLVFIIIMFSPSIKASFQSFIQNTENPNISLTNNRITEEIKSTKKELSDISTDFNSFGSKRGTIWIVGLNALKKYPLTGVGFDNYRYSFEIYPKNFGWAQNKGHNEFIHIFVTQGIPSGINYLLFAFYCCFFAYKKILKNNTDYSKDPLTKIFLIALFAYFIQSLFNSSVTNVAPYKWILMGLLLPRIEQKNINFNF